VRPSFEYGDAVRVIRNLRNDGTYPGEETGKLLIRRGSVGYVRDVGTYLQDELIYSVDFFEAGRMVGCREQEIQLESDKWIENRFEFREKVTPVVTLSVQGEIIAKPGDEGEIEKVMREYEGGPTYHVRFNGRILQIAETSLQFLNPEDEIG
jgi:nitrogen fixation protein NifZ